MDAVVLCRLLCSRRPAHVAAARERFAEAGPSRAADVLAGLLARERRRRLRRERVVRPLLFVGGLGGLLAVNVATDFVAFFFADWTGCGTWPSLPGRVEQEAASLLASWGDVRAADTLIALLDAPNEECAAQVRIALGQLLDQADAARAVDALGDGAWNRLRRLLSEETPHSRPAHPALVRALVRLLARVGEQGNSDQAVALAARALGDVERLGSRATEPGLRAECAACAGLLRARAASSPDPRAWRTA